MHSTSPEIGAQGRSNVADETLGGHPDLALDAGKKLADPLSASFACAKWLVDRDRGNLHCLQPWINAGILDGREIGGPQGKSKVAEMLRLRSPGARRC